MNTSKLTGVGVVVALVLSVFTVFNAPQDGVNGRDGINVGGSSGPEHYSRQFFKAGFQSGGSTLATTTGVISTYTLTNNEIGYNDVSYISWNASLSQTLTSPASSTMGWLGNTPGDTREFTFYSATSTAAATVTFAAGTGVDLQELEGGSVIVNGLEGATLKFVRKSDSDVMLLVAPWQVGD